VSETPFKFGLERVREVRVHAERAAQEVLAASLTQRSAQQAALTAAESSLVTARRTAGAGVPGAPLTGATLIAGQAWVQRLERRHEQAVHASVRAEAQVGDDRVKVLEAARRREALDRLRERRRAEHALAAGRAESARLDEIALRSHQGVAA
jgi:flagellar FliJ protein